MSARGRIARLLAVGIPLAAGSSCGEADHVLTPAGGGEPSPAVVRLVPSSLAYPVGDTLTAEVRVSGASNVGSVVFHLSFDPDVLTFEPPAVEGPFLGADGTTTVFLASAPVSAPGTVVVGASRLGGKRGVRGDGLIAELRFLTVHAGDAGFAFSGASVLDPTAAALPAAFQVTDVEILP